MRTQVTAYEIVRIGALVYKPILFDEFREMEKQIDVVILCGN